MISANSKKTSMRSVQLLWYDFIYAAKVILSEGGRAESDCQ